MAPHKTDSCWLAPAPDGRNGWKNETHIAGGFAELAYNCSHGPFRAGIGTLPL